MFAIFHYHTMMNVFDIDKLGALTLAKFNYLIN
jgi:hypothetical protein